MESQKNINRIKAVLADAGQSSKWLAQQLEKYLVTVSKWCTNTMQSDLQTLIYSFENRYKKSIGQQ